MKITISKINKLRNITGIGIMDCKNALVATKGSIEESILLLRKKGEKIFLNRSNTEIKEGAIISSVNSNFSFGTIIGISCETDFLSRSYDFISFIKNLSDHSLFCKSCKSKEDFLKYPYKNYGNIKKYILNMMGIFKEKLELKIFDFLQAPFVKNYTHNYKISTIVGFSSRINDFIAKNIAMHITAMDPISISEKDIPKKILKEETKLIEDKVNTDNKNKSINLINKIIQGKKKKFISKNTLLNQKLITNNKITIREYVDKNSNKCNIISFKRIKIK